MKQRQHATTRFTEIENGQAVYKVVYHQTIIYKLVDNVQIVNSGGYETATTKQRMNAELKNCFVYQKDYVWYVQQSNGESVEFFDGMKINMLGMAITRPATMESFITILGNNFFKEKNKYDEVFKGKLITNRKRPFSSSFVYFIYNDLGVFEAPTKTLKQAYDYINIAEKK